MIGIPFFGTTDANGALVLTRKIDHAQRVFKLHWFVGQFDAGVDAVLANAGLGVVAPGLTIADSPILTLTNANADAWYPVTNADNALVDQVLKLTVSSGGANKSGGCIVYVGEESEEVAGGDASAANQATGNASLATIAGLSKAEDAAHGSADPGVMLLAVRKDTAAALAGTDGDYIPLIVDASGRLHVLDQNSAAISTGIGAPADAAATTDTGTFALIAFVKRLLQQFAIADVAVTAGATGSISAKLRSISRDIGALLAQLPTALTTLGNLKVSIQEQIIRTYTKTASTAASSGDNTLVAAPSAGNHLVIKDLIIQNESATATTVILKNGAAAEWRALLAANATLTLSFAEGEEWRLTTVSALVLNLSGANSHGYSIRYRTEAD